MKTTKSSREKNTLKNNKIKSDIKNSVLALLNAISDCSFLLDNNGSIEWANVSACKMLSGKKTCHAGQKLFNLLPAQRKELFKNNFDKAVKIKKQISFEVADKGIWHEINLYPIKDGKGNVLQIAVYIKNITESKHAEEALKKSEAIYKAQLENLPDMVMVIDRKFKILNVNKVIFSSGAVEELIGTDALLPIPKEMREMARTKVNECFKTGVIQEFEHKVANNKWVLVRFVPMLSDGKNINEVMIISTDITDRKNAEKMLMDNEERLSNFMESASDGIYILDSELNFIEINKKALEVVRKTK